MIKINIDENKWNEIVKGHWEWFEKHLKTKFRKTNISYGMTYKDFLENELNYSTAELEELIKISWKDLSTYANKSSSFYTKYDNWLQKVSKYSKEKQDDYFHNLYLCFGYNSFIKDEEKAYNFTTGIGIEVCPYCNRSYTFTTKIDNNSQTIKYICRPEIDHFFPKSIFPYLSCTPANFIPSCHQCNHKKSDDYNTTDVNTHTVYPYLESFSKNTVFKITYKDSDRKEYNVRIMDNGTKKEKNSLEAFNLEALYNMHKIEIEDLIQRYRCYSMPKINDILKLFPNIDKETMDKVSWLITKQMRNEILGLSLGDDSKEYPLKKFKKDLIAQFDKEAKTI